MRIATRLVIADFEGTTYGEWKATGEAFGPAPRGGTLPGQMAFPDTSARAGELVLPRR